jgi:hypothetical protein
VFRESREIQRSLSELPCSLQEMMSPQLTRKFADLITKYDSTVRKLNLRFWKKAKHDSLCLAMFRSVLTPYIYEYDNKIISDNFTEDLVIRTLVRVPALRTLRLPYVYARHRYKPALQAGMIHHLKHLQEFTYERYCTDEVIEQLAMNCSHLKKVSLYRSPGVTNAAVPRLLQLRELQFLDLVDTRIDTKHYGLLLSQLPQIKNMEFHYNDENIFDYIAVKNLDSISHVTICLSHWYCELTDLQLNKLKVDLLGLAALTELRTLRISWLHDDTLNLKAVLTGTGAKLTDLSLESCRNVNLQDIVTLCPSLKILAVVNSSCLPLNPDAPLDPRLPHFRNLISLSIIRVDGGETMLNSIRYYVSLKRFLFSDVDIFTVEFMREVLNSGVFANLEVFEILQNEPGALPMEAVELLIERCSHLKIIRGLGTCKQIKSSFILELKYRLLVRNLDLEMKDSPSTTL